MKKIITIFILLFMLNTPAYGKDYGQDDGWTQYFSPHGTFSVMYPYKWPVEKGTMGKFSVRFNIPDDTGLYPQVGTILIIEDDYNSNETFEAFMKRYVNDLKKEHRIKLLESYEVTLPYKKRRAVYWKATMEEPREPGLVFNKTGYVFIVGNRIYNTIYTVIPTIDDPYGYLAGAVDQIMKTIHIIEK